MLLIMFRKLETDQCLIVTAGNCPHGEEGGDGIGGARREGERRGGYSSLVAILHPRGEGLVTFGQFLGLH